MEGHFEREKILPTNQYYCNVYKHMHNKCGFTVVQRRSKDKNLKKIIKNNLFEVYIIFMNLLMKEKLLF